MWSRRDDVVSMIEVKRAKHADVRPVAAIPIRPRKVAPDYEALARMLEYRALEIICDVPDDAMAKARYEAATYADALNHAAELVRRHGTERRDPRARRGWFARFWLQYKTYRNLGNGIWFSAREAWVLAW